MIDNYNLQMNAIEKGIKINQKYNDAEQYSKKL